jgi:lipopolysaccharide transport system permease protein
MLQAEQVSIAKCGLQIADSKDNPQSAIRNPQSETVIRPPQGWQLINFEELWRYRELIVTLAWRDVSVRYKQTILGAAWAILQPAMMMVVFTMFFGRLAGLSSGDVPYPVFVYCGLLPWMCFASIVTQGGLSVVGSEKLITKVYFPRLALPFSAAGAPIIDFLVALGLLGLLMLWYGVAPGASIFVAPVLFAFLLLAGLGMAALLSGLTVAFRDFRYVTPFLVQIWMFATPTIYMNPSAIAEKSLGMKLMLTLNPMTGLIGSFRDACLGNPLSWATLACSAAGAVLLFLLGCFVFRRVEDSFADII